MIKLNPLIRNAMATLVKDSIDSATPAGAVQFYDGDIPTPTGAAITNQVLIASCQLSNPCATVSNAIITFSPITDDLAADNSGTIRFGRVVNGDGVFVFDADAGNTASGAFFKFGSVLAVAGGTVKINAMSFEVGNA